MKIDKLDLDGDYNRAFPFHCPWRVERELPECLPGGSVVRRVTRESDDDAPAQHWPIDPIPAHIDRDDERFAQLADLIDVIGAEDATLDELASALWTWRSRLGDDAPDYLTDEESALLAVSIDQTDAFESIARIGRAYFRHRCDDAAGAVDWLLSSTYTEVASKIVAGTRPVPSNAGVWIGVAKSIRNRYWREAAIVIDRTPVALLGEGDTDLSTVVRADRLRLDDNAFAMELVALWQAGTGRDECPHWLAQTVSVLVTLPDVSWKEAAQECSITIEAWRTRVKRAQAGIRAGIVGELVDAMID